MNKAYNIKDWLIKNIGNKCHTWKKFIVFLYYLHKHQNANNKSNYKASFRKNNSKMYLMAPC